MQSVPINDDQNSAEIAAVRPDTGVPPISAEEEARIDAALRTRVPKPPLTPEQIKRLEIHRGEPISQDDIDGMNDSRARGIHTSIV